MRILLEDKGTGLYLAAPGEWIKNPEKAHGFRNEREAVEAAVREKIINGALTYRFPNPISNFSVPLKSVRRTMA